MYFSIKSVFITRSPFLKVRKQSPWQPCALAVQRKLRPTVAKPSLDGHLLVGVLLPIGLGQSTSIPLFSQPVPLPRTRECLILPQIHTARRHGSALRISPPKSMLVVRIAPPQVDLLTSKPFRKCAQMLVNLHPLRAPILAPPALAFTCATVQSWDPPPKRSKVL